MWFSVYRLRKSFDWMIFRWMGWLEGFQVFFLHKLLNFQIVKKNRLICHYAKNVISLNQRKYITWQFCWPFKCFHSKNIFIKFFTTLKGTLMFSKFILYHKTFFEHFSGIFFFNKKNVGVKKLFLCFFYYDFLSSFRRNSYNEASKCLLFSMSFLGFLCISPSLISIDNRRLNWV